MTSFSKLGVSEPVCRALVSAGYAQPTPIQIKTLPHVLAGRDVLAVAQTGTGKTAAFALPLLELLRKTARRGMPRPRVLVLTPTRELALQVGAEFGRFGKVHGLRHAVAIGGVGIRPQIRAIAARPDVLVGTPGRLLDLMNQRHLPLQHVRHAVLDEADRMLDLGFLPSVRRILAGVPAERQTILCSATMPKDVLALAKQILRNQVRIDAAPNAPVTADRIDQTVLRVASSGKRALLQSLLEDPRLSRVLVFTRTKRGADRLCKQLAREGLSVHAIHGNKTQGARQKALEAFRTGRARILVATDIAARGIDVTGISHVINFDLPHEPESYVHRVGRTARAGAAGIAISFCDPAEMPLLRGIQRLTPLRFVEATVKARPGRPER